MVNEVIVVGKLAKEPVLNQTNTGQKVSNIVLETIRHYKNSYGLYDSDFFEITLWRGMAQTICDTCEIGSIIAIKGRLQPRVYLETGDKNYGCLEIVAEKVSILDAHIKKGSN